MYLRGWMCYTRMDVLREKLLHNCQISKLSILQNCPLVLVEVQYRYQLIIIYWNEKPVQVGFLFPTSSYRICARYVWNGVLFPDSQHSF